MPNPVYADEIKNAKHSLRYIHIVANNVVWILNRIASLMRRKRYNMEEVSLSFDNENKAHFIIAVDWELLDVQQIIHQIHKLHDVKDVYDATHLKDQFMEAFYVTAKSQNEFADFPHDTISIIKWAKDCKWVFLIPLTSAQDFVKYLNDDNYYFIKRLVSLI